MSDYGSPEGVAAYTRHTTDGARAFSSTTEPPLADVQTWLTQRSAQLNGWLAVAGYAVPVVLPASAKAVLDRYANIGVAGDVELSMRSAGHDADDENRRENKFLSEFKAAEAFIASGALGGMGVAVVPPTPTEAVSGFAFGVARAGRTCRRETR